MMPCWRPANLSSMISINFSLLGTPPMNNPLPRPPHPSFWEAFFYWLKLGFISFGGPAGQIALMHQELVEKRRWISEQRFLHALNFCMLLPGPEAQQLTIYIGWLLHRTWGGIVAGTLFVLPSLAILIALTYLYIALGNLTWVQGIFAGIKPAVVAIVLFAAWRIGSRALKNWLLWCFAAGSFLAIFFLHLPFPYIVLTAGLLGYVGSRIAPHYFQASGGHGSSGKDYGPALLDHDTPKPDHVQFKVTRLILMLMIFLATWGVVMATLSNPTLHEMGIFFSKAAMVTFGGAYAVLPYVYQGGVETFGWLTGAQMVDGLALGETTPGPLIMVVAFVGFVGGWTKALFGPDALLLAGMAGAVVATFFTFLPSYLFILAGAPLIESTHGDLKFTAPLTAITAAVVGVIVNLALFFFWHVLWPNATEVSPFAGDFAWLQAVITAGAFIALFRFKQDILRVIGVCMVIGLIHAYGVG
ncbi:MAG: chromate efflux transporter [Magnetococcales bacterium]|nr:chromate efflux transporter [Magnetococcales bacterium]